MSKFANDGRLTDSNVALAENDSPALSSTRLPSVVQDLAAAMEAGGGSPGSPTTFWVSASGDTPATETLTLGGDVYEFLASGATVAADTNIGVVRGGGVFATLTNLVAAINASAGATGILQSDGSAALSRGREPFLAAKLAVDKIRVSSADAPGGNIVGARLTQVVGSSGGSLLTFDDPIAGGGSLDNDALGGANPNDISPMAVSVKISAADIAANFKEIVFPANFTFGFAGNSKFWLTFADSLGAPVVRDEVPMAGAEANVLEYTIFGGGAAPNIQADDTVTVWGRP